MTEIEEAVKWAESIHSPYWAEILAKAFREQEARIKELIANEEEFKSEWDKENEAFTARIAALEDDVKQAQYGWKESKNRIAELEAALNRIYSWTPSLECVCEDPFSTCKENNGKCHRCIAKEALSIKEPK